VEEEFDAVLRHRMRVEYLVEAGKHAVRAALYTTPAARRCARPQEGRMIRFAEQLDQLRIALGEVNILATLTAGAYDSEDWDESDPDIADGIASLLALIKKSAGAALTAFDRLHSAVADQQSALAGERWDYDKDTSPGGQAAMSDQDADIVRRLRERCPDNRFDDRSDAQLLQLFLRNRAAMGWTEEPILDVMTSQK
jgi:hypothetical protein